MKTEAERLLSRAAELLCEADNAIKAAREALVCRTITRHQGIAPRARHAQRRAFSRVGINHRKES